jgi:hypothetical protein
VNQSSTAPIAINVLSNDLQGTAALNPSSVSILTPPSHGSYSVGTGGVVTYLPTPGYGSDSLTYQVCDLATSQPLCSNATVTISVVSRGPTAVDDSVQTPYFTPVTVNVLSNDIAGAQPLQTSSLSVIEQPTNGVVTVTSGNQIR